MNFGTKKGQFAVAVAQTFDFAFDFENFWKLYPKRPGANKTQAARAWGKRIKEGSSAEEIIFGTTRYRHYCETMKIDPQYIKQASTFLGPDKHYESDWTPVVSRNPNQQWLDKMRGKKGGEDEFTIDAE